VIAGLVLLAASGQSCWSIYDDAMRHRAAAAHPAYVQYAEHTAIREDGEQIVRADATVRYRQDGLARIEDSRFDHYSWVTDHPEPGPPELGPFGSGRNAWLPLEADSPVIADVRTHGAAACTDLGIERLHDHLVYHLAITPADAHRPSLKAIWIDADTSEVWKVVVSGRLIMINGGDEPIVDFEVELAPEGPYVMVDHVTWKYREPVFSQYADLFGEYYMSDFRYPQAMPPVTFALDNHAVM